VNVVLLLVMLGVGLIVVMCVDFQWLHVPTRGVRRRHARMGLGSRSSSRRSRAADQRSSFQ